MRIPTSPRLFINERNRFAHGRGTRLEYIEEELFLITGYLDELHELNPDIKWPDDKV